MALIVAWRDPFCLVSDDLETDYVTRETSSCGPKKIKPIPDSSLALGISGLGSALEGVIERVHSVLQGTPSWHILETATRDIASDINGRDDAPVRGVSAVIAGTLGGDRDLYAWGPDGALRGLGGSLSGRQAAFAGTGGLHANIALSMALRYCPEVKGADLLRMIADVATDTDPHSQKPIWRIDLEDGATETYIWLPQSAAPFRW